MQQCQGVPWYTTYYLTCSLSSLSLQEVVARSLDSRTNPFEKKGDDVAMEEKDPNNNLKFHIGEYFCNPNTRRYAAVKCHKRSQGSISQERARKCQRTEITCQESQ